MYLFVCYMLLPNCICSFVITIAKTCICCLLFVCYCCCQVVFVCLLMPKPNCICSFVITVAKFMFVRLLLPYYQLVFVSLVIDVAKLHLLFCYCCCQVVFVCLLMLMPNCIFSFVITIAKLYLFVCYSCYQIVFVRQL